MSSELKEDRKYHRKIKLHARSSVLILIVFLALGLFWSASVLYKFEKEKQPQPKTLIKQAESAETIALAKFIPVEGSLTEYGIPLREKSIELLTYYNYNIQLSPSQKALLENALDILSPCCGAKVKDCECNHDLALKGLAKILISERGYTAEKTREEAVFWQRYFFPAYFDQLEGRETKGSC